jgi:aldose 1-epimerase
VSISATPASGTQYTISHGAYTATIASVGASLRELRFEDRDLVVPFAADEVRPAFRGATLAPWPNRIVGGVYSFGGQRYKVALTEPERGHALHGLVGWLDFTLVQQSDSAVTLQGVIQPQVGYPWRVVVTVTNTLTDAGLATTVTATNESSTPAPWGTGPHPYLVAGPGHVDDWTLDLPAASVLLTTELLAPTEVAPAKSVGLDWREPHPVGDTFIDHAFTDFSASRVRVTDSTGSGVEMTWGPECRWVQLHTADRPAPERSRIGLAVEPMTCPPDAFNSGTDLVTLEPAASSTASWAIAAI